MKTRQLIIYIFICITLSNYAQRIANFNVFASGANVVVRFNILKGSSCNGYAIWHSEDSLNFYKLYDFPGICGNAANDESITYTHNNPTPNITHFYKVELIPVEITPVKRFYVGSQNYAKILAYPNPIFNFTDLLTLQITNASKNDLVGYIYNQFGKPVRFLDLRLNTAGLTMININFLTNGLYLVWLTDGEKGFASKVIVNR
jgi:Secretion system C-terminal sorting domain